MWCSQLDKLYCWLTTNWIWKGSSYQNPAPEEGEERSGCCNDWANTSVAISEFHCLLIFSCEGQQRWRDRILHTDVAMAVHQPSNKGQNASWKKHCKKRKIEMSKAGNWSHSSGYELQALTTCATVLLRETIILYVFFFPHTSVTRAWLRFLSLIVAPVAVEPSASRSRALCRLTHWLTRGYELLKVSLTTHGMSAESLSAEDMYDLMCGRRSTVWPFRVVFSFQGVMSGQCCLARTSTTTSTALDTRQSSVTGNHLFSTWIKEELAECCTERLYGMYVENN